MKGCKAIPRQGQADAESRRGGIARRRSPSTRYGGGSDPVAPYVPSRAFLSEGITGVDPNQRLRKARWKLRPLIVPLNLPES